MDREFTLSQQIRKKISSRIILTITVFMVLLFVMAFLDIHSYLQETEENLNKLTSNIDSYIVSQQLIKNRYAISLELDQIEKKQGIKIKWVEKGVLNKKPGISWVFPFNWRYYHSVVSVGNLKMGYYVIDGSLFKNPYVRNSFITKVIILIVFFIVILIMLYPLIKTIPEKLILNPINDLINDLSKSTLEETKVPKSPEVASEIRQIKYALISVYDGVEKNSKLAAHALVSKQLAHDIRSPLAALNTLLHDVVNLPENQRNLIRVATQRINDIANNLLIEHSNENNDTKEKKAESIYALLDLIVSEKRAQFNNDKVRINFSIDECAYMKFAKVNRFQFMRIISNLLNNASEATLQKGDVEIRLSMKENFLFITIKDEGVGIPKNKINLIFNRGFSYGKELGTGMGLYHAKETIKKLSGEIKVTSKEGMGTTVSIFLPTTPTPDYICTLLSITDHQKVIILDDDEAIHHVWDGRFAKYQNLEIIHFSNSKDFQSWIAGNDRYEPIYLFDYELISEEVSGLDLIEKFNIGHQSILVTSHFEDGYIIERCKQSGCRILPKNMSSVVPIDLIRKDSNQDFEYEIAFIDDDSMMLDAWELRAKLVKKRILTCKSVEDFHQSKSKLSYSTPIYIDSNLGNGVKGELFAKQLHEEGFKVIYLATGSNSSEFSEVSWVEGIVGKLPPF